MVVHPLAVAAWIELGLSAAEAWSRHPRGWGIFWMQMEHADCGGVDALCQHCLMSQSRANGPLGKGGPFAVLDSSLASVTAPETLPEIYTIGLLRSKRLNLQPFGLLNMDT